MKYREAARRLRTLGCVDLPAGPGGSHRKWRNPATGRATTLPDWGAKDLKLGTLRAVIAQLGLDWGEFLGR